MVHLVYCDNKEAELENILNGKKTMIVRGAAGRKIPHSRVYKNDPLYFIEKGSGLITAKAIVSSVQNYTKLSEEDITSVFEKNAAKLKLSAKQQKRWRKRCLCLVEFANVESVEPMELDHQSNMDDWLILDKIEDVVKGTSIPYNYKNSRFK